MGQKYSGITAKGVMGKFFAALEQATGLAWIPGLAMDFESDQKTETYKWLGQVPAFREWKDGRLIKSLREDGLEITNVKYEATINFTNEDLDRDKTEQIDLRIGELAERTQSHWATLVSTLITDGETGLAYDGQYYFDTDHVSGDSGTLKNLLTASEVTALDVTTAASPTPDEFSKAIMGVIGYMFGYKDDQGEPINETAQEFLVMVPVPLWASAQQAVSNNLLDTGSGTRDNPLKSSAFNVTVVVNPRLAWTTDFCLFRIDAPSKPFIIQEEKAVQMKVLGPGSDHEFKEDEQLFGVSSRRAAGYGFWQYATKSTFS